MNSKNRAWIGLAVGVACFFILGQSLFAADNFACAPETAIEKDIVPPAELTELTCFMKRYEGQEVLHFKVTVKNTDGTPHRFRINIFLDNGKAVGGLLPVKTQKGLVQPGKTATFTYPVTGMTEKPEQITIRISALG